MLKHYKYNTLDKQKTVFLTKSIFQLEYRVILLSQFAFDIRHMGTGDLNPQTVALLAGCSLRGLMLVACHYSKQPVRLHISHDTYLI